MNLFRIQGPRSDFEPRLGPTMRVLIALCLVIPALTAQDQFVDPDFEYSMTLPNGMLLTTAEEQAKASGRPIEDFMNNPRSETPDGDLKHEHRWRDATGRERNISLLLMDGPYPFSSVDKFKEAVTVTMGIYVDQEQNLTPPDFKYGMRVEGVRIRPDGAAIRQTDIFLPISTEPPQYALLRMEALDGDWAFVWPELLATLQSVEIPQPTSGSGGGTRNSSGRRRQGANTQNASGTSEENWATLDVTGSLVLSVLLLMGLFMGGRSTASE